MAKSFDKFAVTRRQTGSVSGTNICDDPQPASAQAVPIGFYGYCISCSQAGKHQEILGDILGQSLLMQCQAHGNESIALNELREVN